MSMLNPADADFDEALGRAVTAGLPRQPGQAPSPVLVGVEDNRHAEAMANETARVKGVLEELNAEINRLKQERVKTERTLASLNAYNDTYAKLIGHAKENSNEADPA